MVAAGTAASTVGRMIKNRPHRLDLIYFSQPLYFVSFATPDRFVRPMFPSEIRSSIGGPRHVIVRDGYNHRAQGELYSLL